MSGLLGLRLVEDADLGPDWEPEAPRPVQVFVRMIATPAGMPWDQARAAALEARVGSPLPAGEVAWRLRRTEPWGPGRPGRHAAFYTRAQDIGERLETTQLVDGRPMRVVFLAPEAQQRRLRRTGLVAAGAAAGVALVLVLGMAVSATRDAAETRLQATEQLAARKLKQAEAVDQLKRQARALASARVRGQSMDELLKGLAWLATAKSPQARVEGLHWDHGFMAAEVRGDEAPFQRLDRPVQKSAKPARPGVWLWGVAPAEEPSS